MTPFTQSNTDPGNCWQTGMACLLDVPAETLPDQVAIETAGSSYNNALLAYLERHHGLTFARIPVWQLPGLRLLGFHLMVGPTVRTTEARPVQHVIVGHEGEGVWDPHPSRAGLTSVVNVEILVPIPDDIRQGRSRMRASGLIDGCSCPSCRA